jgi:hypothetical protein
LPAFCAEGGGAGATLAGAFDAAALVELCVVVMLVMVLVGLAVDPVGAGVVAAGAGLVEVAERAVVGSLPPRAEPSASAPPPMTTAAAAATHAIRRRSGRPGRAPA